MIIAPMELGSFDAWAAATAEARAAVVAQVAAALGSDYEPAGEVGARGLGCVRHVATGYELVLIPGGAFTMGITDDEERAILATLEQLGGFPEASDDERDGWAQVLASEVAGIARAARPTRAVEVAPFLCGRRHLGELTPAASWRPLCEAEWEYVARAGSVDGWLLDAPLSWGNTDAPDRALAQESALGLFDLMSWDGEGFALDGWPPGGGYAGAPAHAAPFAPDGAELDALARGGPCYGWSSEVAGVWAFFAGARSNGYGQGRRAAISFAR